MPYASTVAAGSSISFTVTGEQYVTLTSSGNSEGTIAFAPVGAGLNSPLNTQALTTFGPAAMSARQYGPWGMPGTVTVTCKTGSAAAVGVGMGGAVSPFVVFQSAIPFIVPAGDGATNGLSFNGAGSGAFTLSAAIIAGLGTGLAGYPCFFYLPAGLGLTAGWYYGTFTSDTTGTIYSNTYTSGDPSAAVPSSPSTLTAVSGAGRITQTAGSGITGVTGFTLPAGILGNNGSLEWTNKTLGDTGAGTKIWRLKAASTNVLASSATTNPNMELQQSIRNAGSATKQITSRISGGVGTIGNNFYGDSQAIDTSAVVALNEEFQISVNTASLVRMAVSLVARPMA